jgi:ATP-dependent Clp protease, protease subunit
MPAIAVHHTAVDPDGAWDGPAEEAKLSTPITKSIGEGMYAWYDDKAPDDDGDGWPDAKNAYKFPHHEVANGKPGKANLHGVNNAMARLDGADIPEADKTAVKRHLQAHQDDAPEKKNQLRREPLRIFDGNAKPHERFWSMRNAAETGGDPEMELYGVISEYSWFEDDVTPKMFKDDLYNLGKGGPLTMRIHSPGGDFVAASAMRAIISTYPGQVTARIDGLCASAATLVALGANRVQIQDTGTFMIHEPYIGIMGMLTLDFMGALTNELTQCRDALVDVYTERTGISSARMERMMHDETWLTAKEAVAMGFADEVVKAKAPGKPQIAIMNSAASKLLKTYVNVPRNLIYPANQTSADDIQREAQSLRNYASKIL